MSLQLEKQIQLLREYAKALENQGKTRVQQKFLLEEKKSSLQKQNQILMTEINKRNTGIRGRDQMEQINLLDEMTIKLSHQQNECDKMNEENKNLKQILINLKRRYQEIQYDLNCIQIENNKTKIQQQNSNLLQQIKVRDPKTPGNDQINVSIRQQQLNRIKNRLFDEINKKSEEEKELVKKYYEKIIEEQQNRMIELLSDRKNYREYEEKQEPSSILMKLKLDCMNLQSRLQIGQRILNDLKNEVRQLDLLTANQNLDIIKRQSITYEIEKGRILLAEKQKIQEQNKRTIQGMRKYITELQLKLQKLRPHLEDREKQQERSNISSHLNMCRQQKIIQEKISIQDRDLIQENIVLNKILLCYKNNNKEMRRIIEKIEKEGERDKKVVNKRKQNNVINQVEKTGMYNLKQQIAEIRERIKGGMIKRKEREGKLKEDQFGSSAGSQLRKQSVSERVAELKASNKLLGLNGTLENKIQNLKMENRGLKIELSQQSSLS